MAIHRLTAVAWLSLIAAQLTTTEWQLINWIWIGVGSVGLLLWAHSARPVTAQRRERERQEPTSPQIASTEGTITPAVAHELTQAVISIAAERLALDCCALYWADGDDNLGLVGAVGNVDPARQINPRSGLIGSTWVSQVAVMQNDLENPAHRLPYHPNPDAVRHYLGLRVGVDRAATGILVGNRDRDGAPFAVHDRKALQNFGDLLLALRENHQILTQSLEDKQRQRLFYRASAALNAALTLDETYRALTGTIAQLTSLTDLMIVLRAETDQRMVVAFAEGNSVNVFLGRRFDASSSLLATALKNRCALPADGRFHRTKGAVISREFTLLPAVDGLYVLPLVAKDKPIGALVLLTRERVAAHERELLCVVANHAAAAIDNGLTYQRVEQLATHDGLTGLYNQRTFKQRFEEIIALGQRHQRRFTLLLLDIDHFKSFNDSYGHAVGDRVLVHVSGVLNETVRRTDLLARYGGEEFAVVLEESDERGGLFMAERLRRAIHDASVEVAKDQHQRVTVSIGLTTFPVDGCDAADLFDRADQALYAAKRGGRNQCHAFGDLSARSAA